jgi:hypothetical protein
LGDVTGDHEPELIAFDNHLGADYRVHVIDLATGAALSGWPYDVAGWPNGFPTVADVDNDGLQDICLATDAGELHAVSAGGQLIEGYPKMMVNSSISGVAAGDIDDDGLFELVAATWDGWVYAWDTDGAALAGRADWPMRGVNARNTGVYERSTTSATPNEYHARLCGFSVLPNPVSSRAEFSMDPSMTSVTVEIFDLGGRLVDTLSGGANQRIAWLPQPSIPSGVYFARLEGERAARILRFVVAR